MSSSSFKVLSDEDRSRVFGSVWHFWAVKTLGTSPPSAGLVTDTIAPGSGRVCSDEPFMKGHPRGAACSVKSCPSPALGWRSLCAPRRRRLWVRPASKRVLLFPTLRPSLLLFKQPRLHSTVAPLPERSLLCGRGQETAPRGQVNVCIRALSHGGLGLGCVRWTLWEATAETELQAAHGLLGINGSERRREDARGAGSRPLWLTADVSTSARPAHQRVPWQSPVAGGNVQACVPLSCSAQPTISQVLAQKPRATCKLSSHI